VLTLHGDGRICHKGNGGAYNPLLGWSLLVSHVDILAIETRNLLTHWARKGSRIVTLGFTASDLEARHAEQVASSDTMQRVQALQDTIRESVLAIQELLKAQADGVQAEQVAAATPKNGASVEPPPGEPIQKQSIGELN
jgi:hypothetical protein